MQKEQAPIQQQNNTSRLSITWTLIIVGVIALVVWLMPPLPKKAESSVSASVTTATVVPIVTNLTLEEKLRIADRQLYELKQETAALELRLEEIQEEIKLKAEAQSQQTK